MTNTCSYDPTNPELRDRAAGTINCPACRGLIRIGEPHPDYSRAACSRCGLVDDDKVHGDVLRPGVVCYECYMTCEAQADAVNRSGQLLEDFVQWLTNDARYPEIVFMGARSREELIYQYTEYVNDSIRRTIAARELGRRELVPA